MTDHITKLIEAIEDEFGITPDSQESVDKIVLKIQKGESLENLRVFRKSISDIAYTIEILEMEQIDPALEKLNDLVLYIANYITESKKSG